MLLGLTEAFFHPPRPNPRKIRGVCSGTQQRVRGLEVAARVAAHLNALLVALEEVGARIPRAVPLEELLGEPAIEALVILTLHVGASLPYAVHGGGTGGAL